MANTIRAKALIGVGVVLILAGTASAVTGGYFLGRNDERNERIPVEVGRGCAHYTENGAFAWGAQWSLAIVNPVPETTVSAPPMPQRKPPAPKVKP